MKFLNLCRFPLTWIENNENKKNFNSSFFLFLFNNNHRVETFDQHSF